ncbi:hypothetical protein FKP32DRAFT_1604833 [Trametes sanguinea]|nr:hypothetical protein FKP32DRAFT_1604833 [Trametes sanguinea]
MSLKYGLPSRLYDGPQALVGTLRGDAANFGAKVDFSVFIEALVAIGFRTDDKRTTTDVVVLWAPPKFAEKAQIVEISRPSSPTEWSTADQAMYVVRPPRRNPPLTHFSA